MKFRFHRLWLVLLLVLLAGGAGQAPPQPVFFQTSTIDALATGVYDGDLTFGELRRHGDFGLGTFDALDGEMIALEGRFYQIKSDGRVYPVPDTARTPFAEVTFFRPQKKLTREQPLNYQELEKYLDSQLPSVNLPCAVRIEGVFPYIKARSVPRQRQPYPPLTEVTKRQTVFEFHNVPGVIVGFRCPTYLKGVNVPGYHFHFITADRQAGGHVLDCRLQAAKVDLQPLSRFFLRLPQQGGFLKTDLTRDRQKEIEKAEK
jgi:acetolactate decarboxylase